MRMHYFKVYCVIVVLNCLHSTVDYYVIVVLNCLHSTVDYYVIVVLNCLHSTVDYYVIVVLNCLHSTVGLYYFISNSPQRILNDATTENSGIILVPLLSAVGGSRGILAPGNEN